MISTIKKECPKALREFWRYYLILKIKDKDIPSPIEFESLPIEFQYGVFLKFFSEHGISKLPTDDEFDEMAHIYLKAYFGGDSTKIKSMHRSHCFHFFDLMRSDYGCPCPMDEQSIIDCFKMLEEKLK